MHVQYAYQTILPPLDLYTLIDTDFLLHATPSFFTIFPAKNCSPQILENIIDPNFNSKYFSKNGGTGI